MWLRGEGISLADIVALYQAGFPFGKIWTASSTAAVAKRALYNNLVPHLYKGIGATCIDWHAEQVGSKVGGPLLTKPPLEESVLLRVTERCQRQPMEARIRE